MNSAPILALLLLPIAAAPALAQTPARPAATAAPATPAAPLPAPGEAPERTLAAFGDWVVRCERLPTGRSCEMAQTTTDQRQQPVAVLALGRVSAAAPYRLVAQVPVNIAVGQPARITLDPPLAMPFTSCTPRGCFAEAELRDIAPLRARSAEARLEWRDPAGAEQAVAVSFRGFAAAFEALARE